MYVPLIESTADAVRTEFVQLPDVWYLVESAGYVDREYANGTNNFDTR